MLRRRLYPPAALIFLAILSARRLSIVDAAAGDRTVTTVLSPVKDLEPSLAASAAQGTAVVVVADREQNSADPEDDRRDGSDRGGRRPDECEWEGGGECAVILTRSPVPDAASNLTASAALAERSPRSSSSQAGFGKGDEGDDDTGSVAGDSQKAERPSLVPLPRGPVAPSVSGPPSRILHVLHESAGIVCALTGFASDVRHLVRVAAREVSDREFIYGGAPPSVHYVVRDVLASRVRGAAFAASGRPFGVQALVVGNRFAPGNRIAVEEDSGPGSGNTLQLYTIDPAGGWRHWGGGGTAVGRKADIVRRKLHGALQYSHDDDSHEEKALTPPGLGRPRDWSEALDVAMRSLIESTEMDDEGHWKRWNDDCNGAYDELMGGQFDAVIVIGGRFGELVQNRCFAVDSEVVKASYIRCRRGIATTKMEHHVGI
uniref:Uncharacterized protein n=1 Tax=Odontella aurita TaxID=265563 RepID=A0A7S4JFZ6_9STRA